MQNDFSLDKFESILIFATCLPTLKIWMSPNQNFKIANRWQEECKKTQGNRKKKYGLKNFDYRQQGRNRDNERKYTHPKYEN